MQDLIRQGAPGVAMITVTGAIYGYLMDPGSGLILLAAAGAFFGGVVAAGLFGHPGRWGWGLAAMGAVVATALGAGLAGALIFFPDGLWIAPTLVAVFPSEALIAGPIWIALMALTHLVMRRLRGVA